MKFIAWFLAIVVVLAGAFVLIGVFKPRVAYVVETQVSADPGVAFAVFNNPELTGQWLEGFQSIDNLSGEAGQVGSRWRIHFVDDAGRAVTFDEQITAFRENELFAYEADAEFTRIISETRFESSGSGTRIRMNTEIEGKGVLWKSIMFLSSSQLRKRSAADLERLKLLIERG